MKKLLLLTLAGILLTGCYPGGKTDVPIGSTLYQGGSAQARTLLVLLPGRGSSHNDFKKYGFIDSVKASGLAVDTLTVDAHQGYYFQRNLIERLHDDIILPARAEGYTSIWLVGTSMGGVGAVLYAEQHHDYIDGILLIAPFLGDQDVIDEIKQAGGIGSWKAPASFSPADYQRPLWVWLQKAVNKPGSFPSIYAGCGLGDRYQNHLDAVYLLRDAIPENRVYFVQGPHDWDPWLDIFKKFLKSGALKR